jgi:O-antigen/teichoic acid export membrane protein
MLGGGTVAQAITVLALPVLGRLYAPESFGQLAAVMAVASICASVLHGRYHMAIPVARSPQDPPVLLALSVLLALVLSVPAVLVTLALVGEPWEGISPMVFVATCVFATLGTALLDISSYWFSYRDRFRVAARGLSLRALLTAASQLALGALTGFGVLIGAMVGLSGAVIYAASNLIRQERGVLRRPSLSELRAVLTGYRSFPLFGTPQGLLAAMSWNLLPLLLLKHGGAVLVGHYWVAYRLLIAPLALFNNSYRQVVLRELGRADAAAARAIVKKHTVYLSGLGAFAVLVLAIFGQRLFVYLMGEGWGEAGRIASFLSLAIAADLFKVPSICLLQSQHRQKEILLWEAGVVAVRYCPAIALLLSGQLHLAILAFALGGFAGWLIFTITQVVLPRGRHQ